MRRRRGAREVFKVGGTVEPGHPSYVERQADRDLVEHVVAGDFCYVLTPRQMGKSSLMVRTAAALKARKIQSVVVDLQGIGEEGMTADSFYASVPGHVINQLEPAIPLQELTGWWKERWWLSATDRLVRFLGEVLLARVEGPIVIFVDEIDSVLRFPFSDDFFAAVRACHNLRATNRRFLRLTFVLLGVAAPSDLMQDPTRSPFNIGHRIELTSFTLGEASRLAHAWRLPADRAGQVLGWVFDWTDGHPYLTQRVCAALSPTRLKSADQPMVDEVVRDLFLSGNAWEDSNLSEVRNRLLGRDAAGVTALYERIRSGERVADEKDSGIHAALKLSGIVKVSSGGG
jgi:hypothetical protein